MGEPGDIEYDEERYAYRVFVEFGDSEIIVDWAMRYGFPTTKSGIEKLKGFV